MSTEFVIGEKVDRIEEREITGATIISIVDNGGIISVELEYDEGGSGWWPISCIKSKVQQQSEQPLE